MGNNASSDSSAGGATRANLRPFGRTGALGLTRRELDERCQPSGLYPSCQWEDKAIRRLIGDGKLAPRCKGNDARATESDRECPICFLQYSDLNTTKCCSAFICSECYLQVRPQREKHSACPFCNHAKLSVAVAQQMDTKAVQERTRDEQRVIEAAIRARNTGSDDAPHHGSPLDESSSLSLLATTPPTTSGFGARVEQSPQARLLRARSESLSSNDPESLTEDHLLSALAMTPEDRRSLERDMRAQHTHPLARRVEQEAEERRIENERNYYRGNSGRIREQRAAELLARSSRLRSVRPRSGRLMASSSSSGRNWNDIVDAFQNGGNGEIQSLDDLVVLEAAILLSMEEEARNRREEGGEGEFDASLHARDGFPLVERFLSSRTRDLGLDDEDDNEDDADLINSSAELSETLQGLARRMSGGSRRTMLDRAMSSPHFYQGGGGSGLRGVSEAEQIEMAIALSLQESATAASTSEEQREEEEDTGVTTDMQEVSSQSLSYPQDSSEPDLVIEAENHALGDSDSASLIREDLGEIGEQTEPTGETASPVDYQDVTSSSDRTEANATDEGLASASEHNLQVAP